MDKLVKERATDDTNPARPEDAIKEGFLLPVPAQRPGGPGDLPVLPVRSSANRRRRRMIAIAVALLFAAGGGYGYWLTHRPAPIPAGIAWSNGRIEAQEIDISTKFPGRIAQVLVDEGDTVIEGQVVARMDSQDVEAQLKKSQAQAKQAERSLEEARAVLDQQKTVVQFAQQEFDRTNSLLQRGFTTHEIYDQRRQTLDAANAVMTAAVARVGEAERALDAATHDVELYSVNIADNTLVAPRAGRIQYRIANVGEVLPAGGKVFTMLDLSDVYMDVYLPTVEAGRARIGDEARIVLDAFPDFATPAHVSFIATQAQFTPKAVETKSERDKLMFRVRVRADAAFLRGREPEIRTGLPGVGYVRLADSIVWPERLRSVASP